MTRGPFGDLVYILLWLFFVLLIARLVLDYIQMFARSWRPTGPLLVVAEVIYTVTDPPLRRCAGSSRRCGSGRSRWTCRSWCSWFWCRSRSTSHYFIPF